MIIKSGVVKLGKSAVIAISVVLCFAARAQSPLAKQLLPTASRNYPKWYERFASFTKWPVSSDLGKNVTEIPDVRYKPEALLDDLLKTGVLDDGWKDRLLKVPGWIPAGEFNTSKMDAYIYRQQFENGILHFCDTRPALFVAYSREGQYYLANPLDSLASLGRMMFSTDIQSWNRAEFVKDINLFMADASVTLKASKNLERGSHDETHHVVVTAMMGKDFIVFQIQKLNVVNCELDARIPLFRAVDAKPSEIEKALEYFENLKNPASSDIATLAKTLTSLPEPDPRYQAVHPYEYQQLAKAIDAAYAKLIAAIMACNEPGDVAAIRTALEAAPRSHDLRWKAEGIQKAAIASLAKIGTREAQDGLKMVAETAVMPDVYKESMNAISKMKPKSEAHTDVLAELRKCAEDPDGEPEKTLYVLGKLQRECMPPEPSALADAVRVSQNAGVQVAATKQLADWISVETESRQLVLTALLKALKSGPEERRWFVSKALGDSGDLSELMQLLPILADRDESIRNSAAVAAMQIMAWPKKETSPEGEAIGSVVKNRIEQAGEALAAPTP